VSRPDLRALTADRAAALSNRGLVARAVRELAEGSGPQVTEDADGTVRGAFPSGVATALPPGVTLADASCTCGAPTVCRHRVATALAYAAAAPAGGELDLPAADDKELAAFVGATAWRRALAQRKAGLDAVVHRGAGEVAVRLPTATVHLGSGNLALARCTCAAGPRCEHVALAVQALRAPPGPGDVRRLAAADEALDATSAGLLAEAVATARDILEDGVAGSAPGTAERLHVLQSRLDDHGLTWLATLVEDLEELLREHASRSARYEPRRAAHLLAELAARARAARGRGVLAPRSVLGLGEPREVALASVRLVSLGARGTSDGTLREVTILLGDPASGLVLAHTRRFRVAPDEETDAAALGERTVITGLRVRELAHAEALLRDLRRSARGELRWTAFRRGLASATAIGGPGSVAGRAAAAWRSLPFPVRVGELAELIRHERHHPPSLLRARAVTRSVHVVEVSTVDEVAYTPGRQALVARLRDQAGRPFRLVREHRSVAPHALEAIAEALGQAPIAVAGRLVLEGGQHVMDPCGIVGQHLVVPDLAGSAPRLDVARGTGMALDPLAQVLDDAWRVVADASHVGLRSASLVPRARAAAERLRGMGAPALAATMEALAAGGRERWEDAAIGLHVAAERNGLLAVDSPDPGV
jgi:hypothetical protein